MHSKQARPQIEIDSTLRNRIIRSFLLPRVIRDGSWSLTKYRILPPGGPQRSEHHRTCRPREASGHRRAIHPPSPMRVSRRTELTRTLDRRREPTRIAGLRLLLRVLLWRV